MEFDEKTLNELASQLGLSGGRKPDSAKLASLEKKSDAELIQEISKVRDQLAGENISRDKQMEIVRSLMPMMDSTQKARLMKIIGLLEKS